MRLGCRGGLGVCQPAHGCGWVQVELKNDLRVTGLLHSVDQYLNIKLTDIAVEDAAKFPHMVSFLGCFSVLGVLPA